MTSLLFYQKILKYKFKTSIKIYAFITPIIWLFLAYNFKTYKYKRNEWSRVFIQVYLVFIIKTYILYSLIIRLK